MTARIVVPMKPLAESKSRLKGAVSEDRRRLLSVAMLVHVLRTAASASDAEVVVIGGDTAIEQACRAAGCRYSADAAGDLNGCLRAAFNQAPIDGVSTVAFLPADLPAITREDIEALLRAGANGAADLRIAPDRHNAGTNGLAVRSPARVEPAMGAGSFVRHLAQMAISGARYEINRSQGLGLDIDTPADLDLLLRERPGWWEEAAALADGIEWRTGPE